MNGTSSNDNFIVTDSGNGPNSELNVSTFFGDDNVAVTGDFVWVRANQGNDTISNWGDNNILHGNQGHDLIYNVGSSARLSGGEGDDTLINVGSSARLSGGEGDDVILDFSTSEGDGALIFGGEGDDLIDLNGEVGATVYFSNQPGDDTVRFAGEADNFVWQGFSSALAQSLVEVENDVWELSYTSQGVGRTLTIQTEESVDLVWLDQFSGWTTDAGFSVDAL